MRTGSAAALLAVLLAAGCASTDAPTAGSGNDESAALGPDGEPIPATPTGADATLVEGDSSAATPPDAAPNDAASANDAPTAPTAPPADDAAEPAGSTQTAPWQSGQSATLIVPKGTPVGVPVRDGQPHRYELRAFGTSIEVYMDGQPVPAERIHVSGQSVGVLNASGQVIERLDLPEGWTEDAQRATAPDPSDPFDFRDVKGNKLVPPKVMLGGRLMDPTPALLTHLGDRGVRRDRVCVVTNVIPGLPLAEAGVQNHDIVTAVNEIPDADPESIRSVLRTMKPGEAINLRILRGTETLDFRVVVAPWEATHMVRPLGTGGATPTAAGTTKSARQPTVEELQVDLAAARAEIAALERKLREKDPVRASIRPQPAPAPKVGGTSQGR